MDSLVSDKYVYSTRGYGVTTVTTIGITREGKQ
jgi:hypothetical protein